METKQLNTRSIVGKDWNFSALKKLLQTKAEKFNLQRINEFIDKLNTFKRIFVEISPAALSKNGFNKETIERYTPTLYSKLFNAFVIKSELLDNEQLPGQVALFGLGLPFDVAREKSEHTKDGSTYERQPLLKQNRFFLEGFPCEISFTMSKSVKGRYAVIEASKLQPSHIGNMQNPLHFIPEAQPRNRAMSQSGHSTPKIIAENLRPAEIIEGATAYTGAPIINLHGEVIQGNGRAYAVKYYYEHYPNDDRGYKKWVYSNAQKFGVDRKKIAWMHQPVIVRVVDVQDKEAIELGQYTQKDMEAVASETTQIKSKMGLVTDKAVDKIIDTLLQKDTGEKTLAELIRESDILKLLVTENVIRKDDLELYTRNGVINETGVNFVTKFLLNLIFKDSDVNTSDVFIQLPVALQKAIEKSALYILKCRDEQSISKEVGNAIIGLRDYLIFKPNGSVEEWKNQSDIFSQTPAGKYNELELKLIAVFADSTTQKQVVDYFKNYAVWATDKPGDMFEDIRPALSKAEAVKKVFGVDISAVVEHKPKNTTSTPKIAKPKKETTVEQQQNTSTGVERISDEIAFIKRYLQFNGKTKTREQILNLLKAIQRAIVEKRISKTSQYGNEIMHIQDVLLDVINHDNAKTYDVVLKNVEQYKKIVETVHPISSVALLKRYINLSGKSDVSDKLKTLKKDILRAIELNKIKTNDTYYTQVKQVLSNIEKSPNKVPVIPTSLNGLGFIIPAIASGVTSAIVTHVLDKKKKAPAENLSGPEVMSISEAKSKKYEPIGFTGKFLELIGDACWPTSIFLYGNGGSGKSGLAIQLADELSKKGKRILYVAGEQFNTPSFTKLLNLVNITGGDNFKIVKSLNTLPIADFDVIVIDSKESVGMKSSEDFKTLRDTHPDKLYIITSQGTKSGDFRGDEKWQNEVETMIYCKDLKASTVGEKNRWGGKAEVKIS